MDTQVLCVLGQSGLAQLSLAFNDVDLGRAVCPPAPSVLRLRDGHAFHVVMRRSASSEAVGLVEPWIEPHSQQGCCPSLSKVKVVALENRLQWVAL